MNIFESLENLEISEECFNEIMDMVEELLSEGREAGESLEDYKARLNKEKYEKVLPGMEDREATEKSIGRNLKKSQKGNIASYKKAKKEFMNAQKTNYLNKGKYEDSKNVLNSVQKMYGVDHPVSDTVGFDHLKNTTNYAQSQSDLSKASSINKDAKKKVSDTQKEIDAHSKKAEDIRNRIEKTEPGWTTGRAENQEYIRGVKTKDSKSDAAFKKKFGFYPKQIF